MLPGSKTSPTIRTAVCRRAESAYRSRLRRKQPSSLRCTRLHLKGDGMPPGRDDNVQVTARNVRRLRDRARGVTAFLVRSEPRRPLPGRSLAIDAVIAAVATAAAIAEVVTRRRGMALPGGTTFSPVIIHLPGVHKTVVYALVSGGQLIGFAKFLPQDLPPLPHPSVVMLIGVALTAAPLAVRRRYPIAACCAILGAIIAIHGYDDTPPVAFATGIFAVYSAVVPFVVCSMLTSRLSVS